MATTQTPKMSSALNFNEATSIPRPQQATPSAKTKATSIAERAAKVASTATAAEPNPPSPKSRIRTQTQLAAHKHNSKIPGADFIEPDVAIEQKEPHHAGTRSKRTMRKAAAKKAKKDAGESDGRKKKTNKVGELTLKEKMARLEALDWD